MATALNLIGLVIAFAAFYLLMTQIIYQLSYNHGIKDYERLYRMESDFVYNEWDYSDLVCRPFADALQRIPEVESYSLMLSGGTNESFYTLKFLKGNDTTQYAMSPGNNTVLSTLSPQVINGEINWTDENQNDFIIPKSVALKYFGTVKAKGMAMKMIYNDTTLDYIVGGVYEDFPKESELYTHNRIFYNIYDEEDSLELYANYKCIVKFKTVPNDKEIKRLN